MDGKRLTLTRRRLIQVGGGAAAVLYLDRLPALALADTTAPGFLRRSAYVALVGSQFQAVGVGATLTLTAVSDLVRAQDEPAFVGRDDAFALTFVGPADVVLAGGTHELAHPTLGSFAVFITPIQRPAETQSYELVVDRSVALGAARQEAPSPMASGGGGGGGAGAGTGVGSGSGSASGAGSGSGSGSGQPAAAAEAKAPKPRVRLVELATVARRARVLTADVRVAAEAGIVSVRATLFHGRVEYARAGRLLRGRRALRLNLRELRPVAAGDYVLHVTTTDHHGRHVLTEKRVTLR
jgi:hypothetical protein